MERKTVVLTAVAGVVALSALVWAQSTRVLVINSQVASTDVRVINGKSYVPVTDVAKALNLQVVVNGNRIELTRAGGAMQVDGLMGKTGDWLFDGGWRFRVNRVYRADSYEGKWEFYGEQVYTAQEGKELIVVEYSYRNGNRNPAVWEMGEAFLVRPDGSTEKHWNSNLNFGGTRTVAQALLPGAESTGAWLFQVAPGSEFKQFIGRMGQFAEYDDAVRPKSETYFRVNVDVE